jgi:hypothetical protein
MPLIFSDFFFLGFIFFHGSQAETRLTHAERESLLPTYMIHLYTSVCNCNMKGFYFLYDGVSVTFALFPPPLFLFIHFLLCCRPLLATLLSKKWVDGWGWVVMVERKREKRIDTIKTHARTILGWCVLVCAPRYLLRWPMAEQQWRRPFSFRRFSHLTRRRRRRYSFSYSLKKKRV